MGIWLWRPEFTFLLSLSIGRSLPGCGVSGPGLKSKGLASVWAPASQDSFHVGSAGVGVVSMRGAPLALPTCATAQLKRFFDCGRAVWCMQQPPGAGRFMHLVVLYGYQGADTGAEQLALIDQLFGAALGELGGGCQEAALHVGWGPQRGAHPNPLPGKRDFGWALG